MSINRGLRRDAIDSLFTAVSAVSVTGLTAISISETYTPFGISMIMVVLQFGGIGIMSIGTLLWLLELRKQIGIKRTSTNYG